MQTYLPYILPAVITALLNLIFYISIKKTVDNSIEKFKITYSGILKEKIDIYKKLLAEVYDIKLKINQFQYFETDEFKGEIQTDFNRLIRIYSVNRPFLSQTLIDLFQNNTKELQGIFENILLGRIKNYGNMPAEEVAKREKTYWAAVTRLRENEVLGKIEDRIISEMRKDLNTE